VPNQPETGPTEGISDRYDRVSAVLDELGSWLRRATPRLEWNAVALSTMDRIARRGPQRVSDLVEAERITQPGITGMIARLADAGLVRRENDPTDGRATLVSITPLGRAYLSDIHEQRARIIGDHISRLTPAQRRSLEGAADALAALGGQPLVPGVSKK
jgi:DNA-binding MarR family transcriptional regulator